MFVSELHRCFERHVTIWKQSRTHLLWCQNDMVHHLLQPFFGCNEQVRMVYKSLLRDVSTTTEEKKSFGAVLTNLMQRYIDENKGDELCYETGAQGVFVATMISENSWSKRLVGCLRNILPKLKKIESDGLEFASIQSKISSLSANLSMSGCYPFQGADTRTPEASSSGIASLLWAYLGGQSLDA